MHRHTKNNETMILKSIVSTLLSLLLAFPLFAKSDIVFPLKMNQGHFYFEADVAKQKVEVMLESGIPALLIGQDFYQQHKSEINIPFQLSKSRIRLLNDLYDIILTGKGRIKIGEAIYEGQIFIVEDYEGIALPVQHLKHPDDHSQLISIDLPQKRLTVKAWSKEAMSDGTRYRMKQDKNLGFPLLESTLRLSTAKGEATLKGNLIVDFGNPMLLFLNGENSQLKKAVANGNIELKDARNKEGKVVAKGIYATKIQLVGDEFDDVMIGVNPNPNNLKHLGYLGIKFFDRPVVFDFARMQMIIK